MIRMMMMGRVTSLGVNVMVMIVMMVGKGDQSWCQSDGDRVKHHFYNGSNITWWLMVTNCRALVTHPQNLEIVSEIIKYGVSWTKQFVFIHHFFRIFSHDNT